VSSVGFGFRGFDPLCSSTGYLVYGVCVYLVHSHDVVPFGRFTIRVGYDSVVLMRLNTNRHCVILVPPGQHGLLLFIKI
jgi:hypothetical protein